MGSFRHCGFSFRCKIGVCSLETVFWVHFFTCPRHIDASHKALSFVFSPDASDRLAACSERRGGCLPTYIRARRCADFCSISARPCSGSIWAIFGAVRDEGGRLPVSRRVCRRAASGGGVSRAGPALRPRSRCGQRDGHRVALHRPAPQSPHTRPTPPTRATCGIANAAATHLDKGHAARSSQQRHPERGRGDKCDHNTHERDGPNLLFEAGDTVREVFDLILHSGTPSL